jgi:hypothetical protein
VTFFGSLREKINTIGSLRDIDVAAVVWGVYVYYLFIYYYFFIKKEEKSAERDYKMQFTYHRFTQNFRDNCTIGYWGLGYAIITNHSLWFKKLMGGLCGKL